MPDSDLSDTPTLGRIPGTRGIQSMPTVQNVSMTKLCAGSNGTPACNAIDFIRDRHLILQPNPSPNFMLGQIVSTEKWRF